MDTAPLPTQPTAAPEPVHSQPHGPMHHQVHPEHQSQTAALDYPSNPFATAKIAFAKFWHNTKQSLLGNLGVQMLVFIGMLVAIMLIVFAALAFLINIFTQNSDTSSLMQQYTTLLPPQMIGFLTGSSMAIWVVLGIVGLVGTIILATLLQAIQFATVSKAVIHNQVTSVGEVMKLARSKLWPLLGQALLLSLVGVVIAFVMLLLAGGGLASLTGGPTEAAYASVGASFLGIFALGILVFVAAIIILPRLCFAPFAVVAENVGPVASFKHSWHMTKGHYWEIVGVIGVTSILSTLLSFVTDILTTLLAGNPIGVIVSIGIFFVNLAVILFASAIIGERYLQLKNVPASHKNQAGINIGAFALAIVVAIITTSIQNAVFKQTNEIPDLNNYPELNMPTDDSTLPSYDDSDYPPADATDEEFEQYLRQKYPELYQDTELPTQSQ